MLQISKHKKTNYNFYAIEKSKSNKKTIIYLKYNNVEFIALEFSDKYMTFNDGNKEYQVNNDIKNESLIVIIENILMFSNKLEKFTVECLLLMKYHLSIFMNKGFYFKIFETLGNQYLFELNNNLLFTIEHILNPINNQNFKFYLIDGDLNKIQNEKYFECPKDDYNLSKDLLNNYYNVINNYENKNESKISFLELFEKIYLKII